MKQLSIFLSTLFMSGLSAFGQTAPPAISSLSVSAAIPGSSVTISGTGFNATAANNIVYFGAMRATVTGASTTSLTVTVPFGATYSPVSVNNAATGLTGFSRDRFVPTFSNTGGYTPTINVGSYKDLYTAGFPSTDVITADMDGDGKPDIVALYAGGSDGDGSPRIGIFRNNTVGSEVFDPSTSTPVAIATFSNPYLNSIAVGDIDGDGKPDVVVSGFDSLHIVRNNSSPGTISSSSFASPVTFYHSCIGSILTLEDIDEDGKSDILLAGYSYISLFRNTSTTGAITTTSLASEVSLVSPPYFSPLQITTGDIDGDGKPDLLVPSGYSSSGDLYVFRNTSSAGGFSSSTFDSAVILPNVTRVTLADLNVDGKQDIVYVNSGGTAGIMINNVSPGSISSSSFGYVDLPLGGVAGTTDVKLADMDGDAKPDIVLKAQVESSPSYPSPYSYYPVISIIKNNIAGSTVTTSSFAAPVNFFGDPVGNLTYGAGSVTYLTIDDVNADTRPDIVLRGDVSLTVIHNQLPPPTITSLSTTTGNPGTSVTITGSNFNTSPSGNNVFFGAAKANVVSASATSLSVTVPLGATFEPVSVTNTATSRAAWSASAFLPKYNNSAYAAGTIGFDPAVNFGLNGHGFKVAAGDIDGDGKTDLVMRNGTDSVYVYRNISSSGSITTSSFAAPVAFSAGSGFWGFSDDVKLGDMDNDGKPDIVCGHGDGFSVLRNTSTAGIINASSFVRTDFTGAQYPHWSWFIYSQYELNIADIDGDGKLDVAMSTSSIPEQMIALFHNQGFPGSVTRSSFDEPSLLYFGTSGYGFSSIQTILFSDLDLDGRPELILGHNDHNSGGSNSVIKIYKNIANRGSITVTSGSSGYTSVSSFGDPITYSHTGGGNTLKALATGDIDGDGKPDLIARNYDGDTLKIFRNTASGGTISFAPEVNFSAPVITDGASSDIALGDFDGDGKADIVISNCSLNDSTVSVYRNIASPGSITSASLAARRNFKTIRFPSALTVADLDGDGKSDIIVKRPAVYELTPYTAFSILRNDPSAIYGPATVCTGGTTSFSSGSAGGTWSSSNTAVATVGSTGTVTSISAGTTTISYSYSGGVSTSVLTVDTPASAGSITGSAFICGTGTSALSNAATGGIWSSGNTAVAIVGSVSGIVQGSTPGTAVISYAVTNSCGTAVATTIATINQMPNGIINGSNTVCLGGTLSLTGYYMTGGTWSSATPATASVDPVTGVVTGVATGTTTISYTVTNVCGTNTGTRVVTVQTPASAGTISGPSSVCIGAQITLSRTVTGGTWSSGNTSVATVNSSGRVTGVAAGSVTISYRVTTSCGDVYATMPVTVSPTPATISAPSYMMVGTSTTFSNTVPGGVWASSAPSIGTIGSASGIATGISTGSMVISYSMPGGCYVTANTSVFNTSAIINTIAGNGVPGYSGDGMTAISTALNEPHQITGDAAGNIYFVDKYNDRIRKITPSGIISTVVGSDGPDGFSGDGGQATAATLYRPEGVTFDTSGNMYVADQQNQRVRKITPAGIISTVAGIGIAGISGDGGPATSAKLFNPNSLHADASGNLYICDAENRRVRKVNTSGIITTIAGNGTDGISGNGGPATAASIGAPTGVWTDHSGNIFIACANTHSVRKVNTSGIISMVAGNGTAGSTGDGGPATAALINYPWGMHMDNSDNIYIVEDAGQRVRKIDLSGTITTIAGTGISGFSGDGGPAVLAKLDYPAGIYVAANGPIYISDGDRIRMINGGFATITGTTNVCVGSTITLTDTATGGTWSSSNSYVAGVGASTGIVTGIALGTASVSYTHSGGTTITTVTVNNVPALGPIWGMTSLTAGAVITLSDAYTGGNWTSSNTAIASVGATGIVHGASAGTTTISYTVTNSCGSSTVTRVLTVNAFSPIISTIAGTGAIGNTGNGGPATAATLNSPEQICMDGAGSVYFADVVNHSIKKINPSGVITVVAGTGTAGYNGDGIQATAATLNGPHGVAVDAAGNIYASEYNGSRIRKVSPSGVITTIAGNGTNGYGGDGGPATASIIQGPTYLHIDAAGNLLFNDILNARMRKINTAGIITTIAGTGTFGNGGSGGLATATNIGGGSGVWTDNAGNIYMADGPYNKIRKISPSGIITTIAGNGSEGFAGDGGPSTAALLRTPIGMGADTAGNIYFADVYNHRVRKISTSGIITTVAGTGTPGYNGDSIAAISANLQRPYGVFVAGNGNIYIADKLNYRIRMIGVNNPAAITGTTSICVAATTTLSHGISGGTWTSSNTAVASVGSSSGIVTGLAAGTTTISYIHSGGTATAVVTINALPVLGTITGPTTVCAGSWLTLTDTPVAGLWTIGDTSILSLHAPSSGSGGLDDGGGFDTPGDGEKSFYGLSAGVTTITYTVTNGAGCSSYATKSVTVAPTSSLPAITGTGTVCAGNTTTLSNSTSGGTWSSSNGSIASVNSLGVVTGVVAGTATITYTVAGGSGCTSSVTKVVTVNSAPNAGTITGSSTVCTSATITLSNTVTGGTWSSSSSGIATVNSSGLVTGVAAGTATISYNIINSCGTATTTKIVTVNAAPSAGTITGSSTVSVASTITLSNAVVGGTWTSGATGIATVNSAGIVTGVAAGTAVISYTVTNSCGSASAVVVVTVTGCTPIISTIAGNGVVGDYGDGGPATAAAIDYPMGVAVGVSGDVYIADGLSNRIRKITPSGVITTVAGNGSGGYTGDGGAATATALGWPSGVAVDGAGNIYIAELLNHRVRKVSSSGIIRTIAGNGVAGSTGDGGAATAARLKYPMQVALDNSGNLYITEQHFIRKVNPSGIITTVAGSNPSGFLGDGGPATAAQFYSPSQVAVDGSGNLYIADEFNNRVRKVNSSGIISTFAGTTTGGYSGDGGAATAAQLNRPQGVVVDGSGNVYISEYEGHRIRKVDPSGIISSVAGNGTAGYSGDGEAATAAVLNGPEGMAIDGSGNLLITDNGNHRIRYIDLCPASAPITGVGTLCVGGATSLSHTVSGGTWGSSNTAIATIGSTTGVWTGVATGTATISYVHSGGTVTKIVTVNAAPSAGTITGSSTVSVASSITLSNAVSGGTWSSGATSIATINSSGVVTGVAAGTAVISHAVANSCGIAVATKTVTVSADTSAVSISGDLSLCAGTTTSLTTSVPGGTWSSSTPAKATISAAGVVTGVAAGTSIIMYSVSGSIATVIVTVNAALPNITGTARTCPGTSTTLSNTVTGGTWTSSNISIATAGASTGIITGVVAGTANVVYTAPTGCTKSVIVTINATPTIGGSLSACVGTTANLTSSPAASSWSSSTPSVATINASGVVTAITTGTTTLSVTVATGCTASAVFTVGSITPIDGVLTTCVGSPTSLSNATTGGTWSSSSTGIASVNTSGVVTGVNAGTSTISYTLAGGCRRTAVVTVSALPTITGSPVMCGGNSVALGGSPAGGTWSSANPATATVSSMGVVTGVVTGTTGIAYTAITGCSRTIVATVSNTPGSFTGSTSICAGTTTTLTNIVTGGTWSSSNAGLASVGMSNGVVSGIGSGTVNITYKIGSCLATTPFTVMALPNAITGTAKACVGLTTTLSSTTTSGTWNTANPTIHTVDAAGVVTGISAGTANIIYTAPNTCTRSIVATVNAVPNALTGARGVCVGATTTLASTTGGVLSWSSSNTSKATVSSTGVVTGVALGTSNITYTITSGCYTTAEVTVNAGPSAITGTTSTCAGTTTTLSNATVGGSWSSNNTSIAQIDTNGVITGVNAGTSTITYSMGGGCRVTTPVTVLAGASAISGASTLCTGMTMFPYLTTVGGGAWSSTDPTVATVPATHGAVFGVSAGTSTIVFTAVNGCTSTKVVTVSDCPSRGMNSTGVEGVATTNISLYPNPTKGTFTINTPEAGTLSIYTLDGREVMRAEAQAGTTELSLSSNVATGVYMCRFTGINGATMTVRLLYEQD